MRSQLEPKLAPHVPHAPPCLGHASIGSLGSMAASELGHNQTSIVEDKNNGMTRFSKPLDTGWSEIVESMVLRFLGLLHIVERVQPQQCYLISYPPRVLNMPNVYVGTLPT